jgi:Skp family chaperone for outer membrane proteins
MRNRARGWNWTFLALGVTLSAGVWTLATNPAQANRAATAPGCCVATLDLNVVIESLEERKTLETELQSFIGAKEKELQDMQKKAQQAQDDLKILPEKSKDWFAKRDEVAALAVQFRAAQEVGRQIVEDKRKRMHLDLFSKITDAATRYAQREGFALVISSDSKVEIPDQAPERDVQAAMVNRRVLHAEASNDISAGVAQMLNNEFKAR